MTIVYPHIMERKLNNGDQRFHKNQQNKTKTIKKIKKQEQKTKKNYNKN